MPSLSAASRKPNIPRPRYAIASNFEDERRYFTGRLSTHGTPGGFALTPEITDDREQAFRLERPETAAAVARALTEFARDFPPCEPRTWFVLDLPPQLRAAS
jgi:hypothetical protein